MPPFDPAKVPEEHADLFYHGRPSEDGEPVGLTDEQYDAEKQFYREHPDLQWPFDKD